MDRQLAPRLAAIRDHADALASRLAATAQASTTVGIERATLRFLGVQGLDHAGIPLAASVVERAIGDDTARLSRGILLPFTAALVVYEMPPAELALDVAGGSIDLDLEAEALADPGRSVRIGEAARELVHAALARVEANRTARHELMHILGDAGSPLVGVPLRAALVDGAREEAVALVAGGADLLHVDVPASRELAERLGESPVERGAPDAPEGRDSRLTDGEPAPTGSQRALAQVRAVVDEAAAERRAYVRLAAAALPLGSPELAVVTAFERLDLVDADPIDEIIGGGVDPARALADHLFARRLTLRAGGVVRITDGPLVVGPDLARGTPAPAEVRAGRALALQALSVALGRRAGLGEADMLLGSLPAWILDERDATSTTLAFLVVQHGLHPGIGLSIREPAEPGPARSRWTTMRSVAALVGARTAVVERDANAGTVAGAVDDARTAAATDAALAEALGSLAGSARTRALVRRVADAAAATLEELEARGWNAVVGPMDASGERQGRLAAGTCARRDDAPELLAIGRPPGTA